MITIKSHILTSMIYSDNALFTPALAISHLSYILLDLTVVDQPTFKQKISELSEQRKEDVELIRGRIIDTLLSPIDLNQKVKAVVLTHQCFKRQFKPVDQENIYPKGLTPYQYLISKYQSYLKIGYKINLANPLEIQQLQSKAILKKIKLFSFDIDEQFFGEQLGIVRKYVKSLFNVKRKTQFHFNVRLITTNGLRLFKQQVLLYQYPIQFCMVQTNLLNLIERRFELTMIDSWQQIAFKYTQAIKKYIPSSFGGVLQSYEAQSTVIRLQQLNGMMFCLNKINQSRQTGQKQYKKYHNSGILINSALLQYIFASFSSQQYDHFRVKGLLDHLCFNKLYEVSLGKYKEIKQSPLQGQVKIIQET